MRSLISFFDSPTRQSKGRISRKKPAKVWILSIPPPAIMGMFEEGFQILLLKYLTNKKVPQKCGHGQTPH